MCEKEKFLQTPFCRSGCDVGWCDRASLGGGSPIGRRARYTDGGRGPDWRRCRFTRKVRVRCCLWRLKRRDENFSSRLLYWRRGGDPDQRRCWFARKVRVCCYLWRLKRREKKNSSHLPQAFRRPSQDRYFLNSWAEPGFSVLFEFFQSSQIFLFNVLF